MGWGLGHVCRNQGRPQASLKLASLWTSCSLRPSYLPREDPMAVVARL